MVREEDVLTWFKESESYKRVDVLCGLLNMCLPFELRFAGAYVEELGKRDFHELRGAELRANNPEELLGEVGAAAAARGPQDPRAPRRMALYVSLLRSCNAACARTLHAVLLGLERAGLLQAEPLDELLLLYTMALHHPAFTFDQRSHFGRILERLKAEERLSREQQQPQPQPQPQQQPPQQARGKQKTPCSACPTCAASRPPTATPPPPAQRQPPPQQPPLAYVYMKPTRMPQGAPEQVSDMSNAPNDPLMAVMHESVAPPGYAVQPYNMVDYTIGQSHWGDATGLLMHEILQPEIYNFSSQPSPLISQQTSPCDSRPVSPNVQVLPSPLAASSRVTPRQIQDASIPLQSLPQHEQHHPQHQLTTAFNHLNINDMLLMDDDKLHEMGMPSNAVAQLRCIEKLNGLQRPTHSSTSSSGSKPPTYCYTQSRHQQHSSGSDSSSTESHSPSETPALAAPAPLGPGRPRQPSSPLYLPQPQQQAPYAAVQQQQQQHYPRSVYPTTTFTPYRPNFPPFTVNGEAPIYGAPTAQYNTTPYVPVQIFSQPKLSCWNCGTMGHSGNECKEPSIEEVTRAGGYQLDYSTAPPDTNDK